MKFSVYFHPIIVLVSLTTKLYFCVGQPTITNTENIVVTRAGAIRGFTRNYIGRPVQTFIGIPYAYPPKYHLRFMKPVPLKPSDSVITATLTPPSCIQYTKSFSYLPWFEGTTERSWRQRENCLYLNVWTPLCSKTSVNDTSCQNTKSVIFFIHGGGFRGGSMSHSVYDGGILSALGDVVVVTVNYRLGALGFLQLNGRITGNMGLYDQLLALQWVHDNIAFFGGDPKKVTLMGHEAGAVSVGLHLVSPLSKSYIHQAILIGGAPNWLIDPMDTGNSCTKAEYLANALHCPIPQDPDVLPGRKVEAIAKCLIRKNPYHMIKMEATMQNETYYTFWPRDKDAFVPLDPVMAVARGHILPVNILVGLTKNAGFLQAYKLYPKQFHPRHPLPLNRSSVEEVLEDALYLFPEEARRLIIDYYLKSVPDSANELRRALATLIGDIFINCPSLIMAESFGDRPMNAFVYQFSHRSIFSRWPDWYGVTDFDDVPYIFGEPIRLPDLHSVEDTSVSKMMIATIASFAKTGVPEPVPGVKIPEYTSRDQRYLDINVGSLTQKTKPFQQRCSFWKQFYPNAV